MKTLIIFMNLVYFQSDTVTLDYGNPLYMEKDSLIEGQFKLKNNLKDGFYVVMKSTCGDSKYRIQESTYKDSILIKNINYFEDGCIEDGETIIDRGFNRNPPIGETYELTYGHIETYVEHYQNGTIKTLEILNQKLKAQQLISSRVHYEHGGLYMILEKNKSNHQYWIQYYYKSGELYISGQYDQFNRPSGNWVFYYKNGNKQKEAQACSDCFEKLWRPWTATFLFEKKGDWTHYDINGVKIEK